VITFKVPIAPDIESWVQSINPELLCHVLAQREVMEIRETLSLVKANLSTQEFVKSFFNILKSTLKVRLAIG